MEEEGESYTTTASYTFENNTITTNDDGDVMQVVVKELTSKKLVVERSESEIEDGIRYTITTTLTFEKMN
jgi:hypothetical protein